MTNNLAKGFRSVAFALCALPFAAVAAEAPAEFQKGMTWGFAARPGFFASEEARRDVDEMFATGVRWIVLTPNVWQEQYCSTRQFADFENSHTLVDSTDAADVRALSGPGVSFAPCAEAKAVLRKYYAEIP